MVSDETVYQILSKTNSNVKFPSEPQYQPYLISSNNLKFSFLMLSIDFSLASSFASRESVFSSNRVSRFSSFSETRPRRRKEKVLESATSGGNHETSPTGRNAPKKGIQSKLIAREMIEKRESRLGIKCTEDTYRPLYVLRGQEQKRIETNKQIREYF